MLNVQFSDDTEKQIVSWFASPQDPTVYPHQGEVTTGDARWHAYYDAQPPMIQALLPTPT